MRADTEALREAARRIRAGVEAAGHPLDPDLELMRIARILDEWAEHTDPTDPGRRLSVAMARAFLGETV